MEADSIFKAFAEFDVSGAKQPVISDRSSEKFVALTTSPRPTASAKPPFAKDSTVPLNKEKPSIELVLSSANERRFWGPSPDELSEQQLNRIYRPSLDRQVELLDTAKTYLARGMDARLITQKSEFNRAQQPSLLACAFWVCVATVVIWFCVNWYNQSSSIDKSTLESRVANESIGPRASNCCHETVNWRNRRRVSLRRLVTVAKSVANELDTHPTPSQVSYTVTLGGSEKDSKVLNRRLTSHTLSNTENATSPKGTLPSRLTFGLQLELALTEPASSLGGPVTAATISEIRDPDSDLVIPSGTVLQFETAQYSPSGRVAIDWTKPARLLLADDQTISLRGYLVAEDGSPDLPAAALGGKRGSAEYKRLAQSFLAMGGQYARRRNTIVGDLANSVYRELSEPTYRQVEFPILVTPSGTRFSLTVH
jgi:hypothetical protein